MPISKENKELIGLAKFLGVFLGSIAIFGFLMSLLVLATMWIGKNIL